ncbi:G-protein coupled receptor GRL101-like isoform X2 [Rhodnius prolixus]
MCRDGSRVHRSYWCDGWPDCPGNHADEWNCEVCDGPNDYKCPNGRCIKKANICDSQCDCAPHNGSLECADEMNCSKYYRSVHGVTSCLVGSTLTCTLPGHSRLSDRCIASKYICDGSNDCHNGKYLSDEYGCQPSENQYSESTFRCLDNRTLPESLLCDYKNDCLDGDDENLCRALYQCDETMFTCNNSQCIDKNGRCNVTYECLDKSDELGCLDVPCPEGMVKCTYGGQCIPEKLLCDYFIDCPDESDEKNCPVTECNKLQFQCDNGQCVSIEHHCFISGNQRDGCADNSHLKNCKNFTCMRDHFKCRLGPCLNQSLLCNKKIDCQHTWEDEDNCTFTCSEKYPECPCKDIYINCTALGLESVPLDTEGEITWFHLGSNKLNASLTNETFSSLDRLLYLDLSNNSITGLPPMMFSNLWRLTVLNLQNNRIHTLVSSSFYGLASLKGLHLQGNGIRVVRMLAFYGLSSLRNLDLHDQNINLIEPDAFLGLRSLVGLDLSQNKIEYISDSTFRGMPHLLYLDISNNYIDVIDANAFRMATTLEKLVTDEFRFCCLARHVKSCLPPRDEFSSCEDLMSNMVLRICVWALAVIATVGNILVIACRARYKHCNQVHSFLITNLALGDLLMGSYLLLIAVVDWHYRGVYFIHDSSWRSSQLCSFAGFISTFSSELSVFTLTVITLDRFLVIIFPFRVRRLEMTRTRRLMAFGWIVAISISAVPLIHIDYFKNFYGRSGVCLALHITPDKPNGWEYSVFVFLFLNLVSFTIIAVGYLWMFLVARTTQHAVNKDRRTSESAMAWRMTLLVATDAACWVPIIILGIVSLAGYTVPPQVFAWVAVFVLPLNAAVNPVLYTLSTAPFLTPARHGFLTFRRSCKMSLSQDQRRTYTSGLNHYAGSMELYSMSRRSMRYRNSLDTSVTEHGVVLPILKDK